MVKMISGLQHARIDLILIDERAGAVDGEPLLAYAQALVSLKLKKSIDAEGGRTFAVIIEGG